MAIRPFSLNSIGDDGFLWSTWPDKARREAIQFIVSAGPWFPLHFLRKYGKLVELASHDGSDDPPDVQAKFWKNKHRNTSVGFEMTSLLPTSMGRYEAWIAATALEQKINMLHLGSDIPATPEAMLAFALEEGEAKWVSVDKEFSLWKVEARAHFDRKTIRSGYDYVVMHANPRHIPNFLLRPLVHFFNELLQKRDALRPCLLISSTCYGFNMSWLLEKGEPIVEHFTRSSFTKITIERRPPSQDDRRSIFAS